MSSLDRLIRLAERTGDRLIVHDSAGEKDFVIMDVDSYERLLDLEPKSDEFDWLAPEPWEKESEWKLREEMDEGIDLDDLDDDEWKSDKSSPWYSAAEVFDKRSSRSGESWSDWSKDEIKIEDIPFGPAETASSSAPDWQATSAWARPDWEEPPTGVSAAASDLGMPKLGLPVPPSASAPPSSSWAEEPLGEDEPVFYEEPV